MDWRRSTGWIGGAVVNRLDRRRRGQPAGSAAPWSTGWIGGNESVV
jgi:hypothetical protein